MANVTGGCRQYDEDWHPCPFPYTSPSASFNYRDRGHDAEFDDDSCSITYAASTGSLHFIGCVVHTSLSALATCYFFYEFRKSRGRTKVGRVDHHINRPIDQPTNRPIK